MTAAQWLSIALAATYVALFLLFLRIFRWKLYADQAFYHRRPKNLTIQAVEALADTKARGIPRFSIFVPARNEAEVIEKTIDHLARLDYPADRYEILVVTDEKEAMAARELRAKICARLLSFLTEEAEWEGDKGEEAVLLALLSRLALEESDSLPLQELRPLPGSHRLAILHEAALALAESGGKAGRQRLCGIIRRIEPGLAEDRADQLCPALLSLASQVVLVAACVRSTPGSEATAHRLQPLGRKVLVRLHSASPDSLKEWLAAAATLALPTTQDIVERKRAEFTARSGMPALKHVEVPYDFDGAVDGVCTGHTVPSTKGRALNWSFRFADPQSEIWAFYDAESRPDPRVLLYVAWRRLTAGDRFQIAQGPVYQIRNFWKTGPLSKIAGLYQAISHEWQMPWLLQQIPFIGGTNIFATRDLMLRIGGFDNTVLTEDMELGARAWLKGGAWPEFLPYSSSEQTPPTFWGFFRQRLRWGSGYLQVYDKIRADRSLPREKRSYLLRIYWWKGPFEWTFYQAVALLPIAAVIFREIGLLDPAAVPRYLAYTLCTFGPCYLLFTLLCFFHFHKYMEPAPRLTEAFGFAQLLLLPISSFFLPVPYSSALVLKWSGHAPTTWVKTPRTKE